MNAIRQKAGDRLDVVIIGVPILGKFSGLACSGALFCEQKGQSISFEGLKNGLSSEFNLLSSKIRCFVL